MSNDKSRVSQHGGERSVAKQINRYKKAKGLYTISKWRSQIWLPVLQSLANPQSYGSYLPCCQETSLIDLENRKGE